MVSHIFGKWSETIAADRDFSPGFPPDRDYRSTQLSSETRFKTALGNSDLLLAASDRPFGADRFYGNFNSWERTKDWLILWQQVVGTETTIDFGYRRHSDEFVLLHNWPSVYENNHVTESWQAELRRHQRLGDNSTLSYGLEADDD